MVVQVEETSPCRMAGVMMLFLWHATRCNAMHYLVLPKVYISDGRPLFVLSEAQKEEVIAQSDSHLKTAKGRGYRRQITRPEGERGKPILRIGC